MQRLALLAALALAIACAAGHGSSSSGGAAGLATVFDSSGDTIVARVDGDVPSRYVRSLTDELRIAPSADDTSLFGEVRQLTVGLDGRIWVYDEPSNSVFLFAPDGTLIRRVGRHGQGPGEFQADGGMAALPDSGVAIWDPGNARVSFFDRDGEFRSSRRTPGGVYMGFALRSDRSGAVYLRWPLVRGNGPGQPSRWGLARISEAGEFSDSLLPPELDVRPTIYTSVGPNGRVSSSSRAEYAADSYWDWNRDGWFVVANGGTGEIILAPTGRKPVVIRRTIPLVPISDGERSAEEARILFFMQRTQPGWTMTSPLPETKAPVQSLFVARDGHIWVMVATPSERIPDDQLPPRREGASPAVPYRQLPVYEVFDTTGRFLGRVALPRKTVLMAADGNTVWLLERDADDLPAVVRAHITPRLAEMPPVADLR